MYIGIISFTRYTIISFTQYDCEMIVYFMTFLMHVKSHETENLFGIILCKANNTQLQIYISDSKKYVNTYTVTILTI